jgi:hypothetical protein
VGSSELATGPSEPALLYNQAIAYLGDRVSPKARPMYGLTELELQNATV